MKKLLLLASVIILAGCQSVPVIPKWPDVPKELIEACPDLKTVEATNDKLSVVLDTVVDNYKEYYGCKDKVNDWITWYNGQQKLWKSLK